MLSVPITVPTDDHTDSMNFIQRNDFGPGPLANWFMIAGLDENFKKVQFWEGFLSEILTLSYVNYVT